MPTMIFTHQPNPGVSFKEFQKHLVEVDMPWNLENPAVIAAKIYRVRPLELDILTHGVTHTLSHEDTPFDTVEVMQVRSFEEFLLHNNPTKERIQEWNKYGDLNTASAFTSELIFQSSA